MAFDTMTHAGSAVYVCATAQTATLTKTGFEALTWVQIKKVIEFPESGIEANITTVDYLDTDVSEKSKGVEKSVDWPIKYGFDADDAGQDAIRTAAGTRSRYAVKLILQDGTVIYNIGPVSGPKRSGGGPDDPFFETVIVHTCQRDVVGDPV